MVKRPEGPRPVFACRLESVSQIQPLPDCSAPVGASDQFGWVLGSQAFAALRPGLSRRAPVGAEEGEIASDPMPVSQWARLAGGRFSLAGRLTRHECVFTALKGADSIARGAALRSPGFVNDRDGEKA